MAGKKRFADLELACVKCNKLCANRGVKRLHESRCTNDVWRDVITFSARSYAAIGSSNLMAQPLPRKSSENSNEGRIQRKRRAVKKVDEQLREQGLKNDHTYNTTSDNAHARQMGYGIQNDHTYITSANVENNRNVENGLKNDHSYIMRGGNESAHNFSHLSRGEHGYSLNSSDNSNSSNYELNTEHSYSYSNANSDRRKVCWYCSRAFKYYANLKEHERTCLRCIICRKCGLKCADRQELYEHRMEKHAQSDPSVLQPLPWDNGEDNLPPWNSLDKADAERMKKTYLMHKEYILANHKEGDVVSIFNIPLDTTFNVSDISNFVKKLYEKSHAAFKLNFSFGIILQNIQTKEYRYFKPYRNTEIFEEPFIISNRSDLVKMGKRLNEIELVDYLMKQRPNTKFRPVMITNCQVWFYNTAFVLGHEPITLPTYLSRSKSIMTFEKKKESNREKYYRDNLCAFRCLAYHFKPLLYEHDHSEFIDYSRVLFRQWKQYIKKETGKVISDKEFKGIDLNELALFEDCFQINLHAFRRISIEIVLPVFKTMVRYQNNMYVDIHENHMSLITNIKSYSRKYQCRKCGKFWVRPSFLYRHEITCEKKIKKKFKSGFVEMKNSVFDELSSVGIVVDEKDRYYPWFIVYDFESILHKISKVISQSTELTQVHLPVSVSVCSNVEGYRKPKCIMQRDHDEIIEAWFSYMDEIAAKIRAKAYEKWGHVFVKLEKLIEKWKIRDENNDQCDEDGEEAMEVNETEEVSERMKKAMKKKNVYKKFMESLANDEWQLEYNEWENGSEQDNEEEEEEEETEEEIITDDTTKKLMYNLLLQIQKKFRKYVNQVVVVGFNSSKYDLLLCKSEFCMRMNLHKKQLKEIIKTGQSYPCIANENYRFLDVLNFLAPGFSYTQFLKAFEVTERKLFFPYDYIDSIERLDETKLPDIGEAWYSDLKSKSVLDDGENSISDNYALVQKAWKDEKMESLWSLLAWYNDSDTEPFCTALERFQAIFFDQQVDVFKCAISTPGVARTLMFRAAKEAGASFACIDESNKDLFYKIKQNLTGGPSIVYTREMKSGYTKIRNNKNEICSNIFGYDANSLYLSCLSKEQPSGPFIRRKEENDFRPEIRDRYQAAYCWMQWLNMFHNKNINHKMNNGSEKRIGPYQVDGYSPDTDTVWEFNVSIYCTNSHKINF